MTPGFADHRVHWVGFGSRRPHTGQGVGPALTFGVLSRQHQQWLLRFLKEAPSSPGLGLGAWGLGQTVRPGRSVLPEPPGAKPMCPVFRGQVNLLCHEGFRLKAGFVSGTGFDR